MVQIFSRLKYENTFHCLYFRESVRVHYFAQTSLKRLLRASVFLRLFSLMFLAISVEGRGGIFLESPYLYTLKIRTGLLSPMG